MNIVEIQDEMKQLSQVEVPVRHIFADNCYAREITMKKGVALVGALHKTNHHYIVSKGKIMVRNGSDRVIIEAPYHGITNPGDKRLIVCLEDAVMTTFHVTDLTDVQEIGRRILGEEL